MKKTQRMEVRLTEEQFDKVVKCAQKLGISNTQVIERGIETMYADVFMEGERYIYRKAYEAIIKKGLAVDSAASLLDIKESELDAMLKGKKAIHIDMCVRFRDLFAPDKTLDELFPI